MDRPVEALRYPFPEPPAPGSAVELAEGVLWLRLALPFRPDHLNVYAIDDGDAWTLVDTGLDNPACREAWDALLAGPLAGRPVGRVILTHHHPDHVGLVGHFQALGAELWTTRTAWLMARMLTLDRQDRPSAELLDFWRGAGMDGEILAERAATRPFNFADMVRPLPLGYRRIGEGDEIVAGGRRWRVAIGHGHAPEQATLFGIDHDLVLVGDQVLPTISPNLGVYATEPDADPVGEFLESCARLGTLATARHLALPGHGRPFLDLPDRLAALAASAEAGLDRLRGFLAEPRRAADCFPVLYGRRIGAAEYGLALAEALGHLNRLTAAGEAGRRMGSDGAWRWRMGDFGT